MYLFALLTSPRGLRTFALQAGKLTLIYFSVIACWGLTIMGLRRFRTFLHRRARKRETRA
jgi:hypothetical protein